MALQVIALIMFSEQYLYKAITFPYEPRAITIRKDNGFHKPGALTIENDNFSPHC